MALGRPRAARSGRQRGPGIVALLLVVLMALGLGGLVGLTSGGTPPPPPAERADAASAPDPSIPSCRDAGLTAGSGRSGVCRTRTSLLAIAPQGKPVRVGDLEVTVRSARYVPASTAEGKARQRARVTVNVRVRNLGNEAIEPDSDGRRMYLASTTDRARADVNALERSDALHGDRPLAPGDSASGLLRFEISGAFSRRLRTSRAAELGIAASGADRVGVVRLALDLVPAPAKPATATGATPQ